MQDWFTTEPAPGVDPNLGGVFEWRIQGEGKLMVYVGGNRCLAEVGEYYRKHVKGLQDKQPSRHRNRQYRRIYHVLRKAKEEGHPVSLVLTENVSDRKVRGARELAIHAAWDENGATVLNENLKARLKVQRPAGQ